MNGAFEKNEPVWFSLKSQVRVPAVIVETIPLTIRCINNDEMITLDDSHCLMPRKLFDTNVEDLCDISDKSDSAILLCLRERFKNKRIYTFAGEILISVNPYEFLPIYDDSIAALYLNNSKILSSAHIYSVAQNAMNKLKNGSTQESICFSGESGSGKTMNLLQIAKFLTHHLRRQNIGNGEIDAIFTIINSFGSAKTLKNDTATRFGYSLELHYKDEMVEGIAIRNSLLLELNRTVSQKHGEKNYNVFYEFCSGLEASLRQKFGIKSSLNYFYLNHGKCIDDENAELSKFMDLQEAFEIVGFTEDQLNFIYRILATILHIGNIFFRPRKSVEQGEVAGVEPCNKSEVKWSAYLLEVDLLQWSGVFTCSTSKVGDEEITMPLNVNKALDTRDGIAQLFYKELLNWIFSRISSKYQCVNPNSSINLIDLYGFEKHTNNAFEQFCINLVNERMENFFIQKTLKEVFYDYQKQEIEINYQMSSNVDNERILDILLKRPDGIVPLLDDECKFPKASSESFLQRCNLNHLDKTGYAKARAKDRQEFAVKHFCGLTFYSVSGFIEKNRWFHNSTVISILAESRNTSIAQVFRGMTNKNFSNPYVAQQYNRTSKTVVDKLKKGGCQFVRCLRSNNERQSGKFCDQTVSRQLCIYVVMDTVKIRRYGFPTKYMLKDFVVRFRCLLPFEVTRNANENQVAKDIIEQQGSRFSNFYKIGKDMVYMKDKLKCHLESLREEIVEMAALTIQKNVRKVFVQNAYQKKRHAVTVLQAGLRGWKTRREVERLRVERRRKIDAETREIRRHNLYLESGDNDEGEKKNVQKENTNTSTAIVDYLDLPDSLKKLLEKEYIQDKSGFCNVFDYFTQNNKFVKPQLPCISLEEFAKQCFKNHLLEVRREPIITPFLPKDTEKQFNDALEIFRLILRYMNDVQLADEKLALIAKFIIQKGIDNSEQRDEIFIQLCNQTYHNRIKANVDRAWTLMLAACSSFAPSIHIFPVLMDHFQTAPGNLPTLLTEALLRRVKNKDSTINRCYAPSIIEQVGFKHRQPSILRLKYSDSQEKGFEVDSWMTCDELSSLSLLKRGIGEADGWSISVETPKLILYGAGNTYIYDLISRLEDQITNDNNAPFIMLENRGDFKTNKSTQSIASNKDSKQSGEKTKEQKESERTICPQLSNHQLKPPTPPPHQISTSQDSSLPTVPPHGLPFRQPPLPPHRVLVVPNQNSTRTIHNRIPGEAVRETKYSPSCALRKLPPSQINDENINYQLSEPQYVTVKDKRKGYEQTQYADFDDSLMMPADEQVSMDGQTMRRYRQQQQQYLEMRRCEPRQQYAYVPQQLAMSMMPAQVQFMPVMLPATISPVPMQATTLQPTTTQISTLPRAQADNIEKLNASVMINCNNDSENTQESSNNEGQIKSEQSNTGREEAFARGQYFDQSTHNSKSAEEQSGSACDFSNMSISSRIRRMRIPTKNSDVDRFLDEVFEQALPQSEVDITLDQKSRSVLAASIKGGVAADSHVQSPQQAPLQHYSTPMIFQNDSSQSNYVSYPTQSTMNYSTQPVMMMMPMPGQIMMQQRNLNNQIYEENQSNLRMTAVSPVIPSVPVMIPSLLSSAMVMCMSPTPSSACLSPIPYRNERDDLRSDNDLSPFQYQSQGQKYESKNQSSATMLLCSSPLPKAAQSPTNLDTNSRIAQLNPTSAKARYVGPLNCTKERVALSRAKQTDVESIDRLQQQSNNGTVNRDMGNSDKAFYESPYIARRNLVGGQSRSSSSIRNYNREDNESGINKFGREASLIAAHGHMLESQRYGGESFDPKYQYARSTEASNSLYSPAKMPEENYTPDRMMQSSREYQYQTLPHEPEYISQKPVPLAHAPRAAMPVFFNQTGGMGVGEWFYESDISRPVNKIYSNSQQCGTPNPPSSTPPSIKVTAPKAIFHSSSIIAKQREKPAIQYKNQPWSINVRKELFSTNEQLDDVQEIDLIFCQIINDCRKEIPYRIRNYERDSISQVLRNNRIPPAALDKPFEIPIEVKIHIIEMVRRWPLYFCRFYLIVEEQSSGNVHRLLGISESGIRLISFNSNDPEEPFCISDHFEYGDIAELNLEGSDSLKLLTRKGLSVIIKSKQVEQIRNIAEKYIVGIGKVKVFMRAVADYVTNEPNLLSFKKDDVIQIIKRNNMANNNENWLFGRIGNKYGNLPANYVQPIDLFSLSDSRSMLNSLSPTFDEQEYGEHLPSEIDSSEGKFSMMEFAALYFRRPKHLLAGDSLTSQRKKKEWSWKDIADKIKYTTRPISHSLLRLDNSEANKLAQESFLCIMRYMGDESLKRGQTLTDCVYELLMICHQYRPLRDEVYCQLMRQTTNNRSVRVDSAIRGWRLFSIVTAYFDCSQVLKPYLYKYIVDMANDPRRPYHGTAQICLQNLTKTFKYSGRRFLLSGREIEAITMGKNIKRQLYHLPGGHRKVINTKPVSVVEEVIQELCLELNIRSATEQQEFCLCYILESENVMKLLSNDEYIMDICTELEHRKKEYFLLLKRTVWIHPLRLDNILYIDMMFFQVVPDYIEGLLIAPKPMTLSAALLDEIARLGALLHLSDKRGQPRVTSQIALNLVPKLIVSMRSGEQWAERINSKLAVMDPEMNSTDARATFLEVLVKWPLFGSTFFYVRNMIDYDEHNGECLSSINKNGLNLYKLTTREIIVSFSLTEILSTNRYSSDKGMQLDIRVGTKESQRTISLFTDQGGEISRLLGQYLYVASENQNFIDGGTDLQ